MLLARRGLRAMRTAVPRAMLLAFEARRTRALACAFAHAAGKELDSMHSYSLCVFVLVPSTLLRQRGGP